MTDQAPLVTDVLPRLAEALVRELTGQGEDDLAAQIAKLRVVTPCRCTDSFCQSFWTVERTPGQRYPGEHRTVPLLPDGQMVNLDVVDGRIIQVEIIL